MGSELVGWKNTLALTPYGARFREYRKMMSRAMGTRENVKKYHALEEEETHRFLVRVLARPQDFVAEIRKTAGAIILMISHGYKVHEHDDPIVDLVDRATEQFSLATEPGAFLVDVIPQLQYIPEWFPGAGFKRTAKVWAKCLADMADIPHQFVKEQMAAGTAVPSFTSELLGSSSGLTPESEFNIKWSAASLYSGGADTTVSSITSFFLAMTLNPEVQKKAQAEIDAVVGPDRLPSFGDRERLPYIEALVKEVFRWNPVTPTGVPRRVTEDDVYEGFCIPQGTLVITNIWQLLHDPEVYSNPLEFNPDRFMGPNPERDPRDLCFGFGRRICPGLNLADASVFISSAMSLAVFDITKSVDSSGRVIEPKVESTDGTISHPKPFQCTIRPRSSRAAALISADS
jgi:cytochrome P450